MRTTARRGAVARRDAGRRRGAFVVVEGVDFSGKTTAADALVERLRACGVAVRYNSARMRRLRSWAKRLERAGDALRAPSDALFLAAVVYDTLLIAAWLRAGTTVVQDRYYASYLCHQKTSLRLRGSRGSKIMLRAYVAMRRLFLVPDAVVYCRSDVDTLIGRFDAARSSAPSSLSANDVAVYSRARLPDLERHQGCFDELLAHADRTIVIDNAGPVEELRARAARAAALVVERRVPPT